MHPTWIKNQANVHAYCIHTKTQHHQPSYNCTCTYAHGSKNVFEVQWLHVSYLHECIVELLTHNSLMEVGDAQANNNRDWNRETAFKQLSTTSGTAAWIFAWRRIHEHVFRANLQEEFAKFLFPKIQSKWSRNVSVTSCIIFFWEILDFSESWPASARQEAERVSLRVNTKQVRQMFALPMLAYGS